MVKARVKVSAYVFDKNEIHVLISNVISYNISYNVYY